MTLMAFDEFYLDKYLKIQQRLVRDGILTTMPELTTLTTINLGDKKVATNWDFKSNCDADINWEDIKSSLSYKEPLALITRKYKEWADVYTYVMVSEALWQKAAAVNMVWDNEDTYVPDFVEQVGKRKMRCFRIENKPSEWVNWAKAVKAASWPETEKSEIKVVLPKV
jgi:hypothetical protein